MSALPGEPTQGFVTYNGGWTRIAAVPEARAAMGPPSAKVATWPSGRAKCVTTERFKCKTHAPEPGGRRGSRCRRAGNGSSTRGPRRVHDHPRLDGDIGQILRRAMVGSPHQRCAIDLRVDGRGERESPVRPR